MGVGQISPNITPPPPIHTNAQFNMLNIDHMALNWMLYNVLGVLVPQFRPKMRSLFQSIGVVPRAHATGPQPSRCTKKHQKEVVIRRKDSE